MGRVWSVDAVAKNDSTSMYGSLIALAESPLEEGLLYAGTDDGVISVSEDGGNNWRRVDEFRGVPDMSLIEDIIASHHDADVAYAVVDNHKRGDFAPYVLKTSNRGKSWSLISNDLPDDETAHTIAEDPGDPSLLFVGTEFGVYFSNNRGENWQELTSLPTISVRDMEIQAREHDLVLGTFGLGVHILEDYRPLRAAVNLDEPTILPTKDAWLFMPDARRGWGGMGDYGHDRYGAQNPEFGAKIRYYLPESFTTLNDERRKAEKERAKEGEDNPYPSWESLREEDWEQDPMVILTIRDANGDVVRRLTGPASKGMHQVAWDYRYPAPDPVNLNPSSSDAPWAGDPQGPLVVPGAYSVSLAVEHRDQITDLVEPQTFMVKALFDHLADEQTRRDNLEFQQETAALYRQITGTNATLSTLSSQIDHLQQAVLDTPAADTQKQRDALRRLELELADIGVIMSGDRTIASRNEATPVSLFGRLAGVVYGHWGTQMPATDTQRENLQIAQSQYAEIAPRVEAVRNEVSDIQKTLNAQGAPYTPGS